MRMVRWFRGWGKGFESTQKRGSAPNQSVPEQNLEQCFDRESLLSPLGWSEQGAYADWGTHQKIKGIVTRIVGEVVTVCDGKSRSVRSRPKGPGGIEMNVGCCAIKRCFSENG